MISLTVYDTSGLTNSSASVALVSIPAPGSTSGAVYDARHPIAGAHVYLFAANTTGYGQSSVSLLNAAATGHVDAIGAYVLTAADGGFVWAGSAGCAPGTQVYVYALGGTTSGGTNPAAGLLAAVGNCPSGGNLSALPYVWVNEISTVAAAYAMAGFATDATHVSSSGTAAAAQIGIANAFANAGNIASLATGVAYAYTPAENGIVPQGEINTLANILAACVGSSGPTSVACTTLFADSAASGPPVVTPTDTATAAINIAHNPGANVNGLFALVPSSLPFVPTLIAPPGDYTLSISLFGGGLAGPQGVAIDTAGNVWVANLGSSHLSEFTPLGLALSSSTGYSGGGLHEPAAIAIDLSGNAWVANLNGTGESEFSGYAPLSPSAGYPICAATYSHGVAIDASNQVWFSNEFGYAGVTNAEGVANAGCVSQLSNAGASLGNYGAGYFDGPFGIAIDGTGNVWISNQSGNSLTELSSTGVPISPFAGYTGGGLDVPDSIAIDGAGNAWVADAGGPALSKFSNSGSALSPSIGFQGGGLNQPESLAIDGSGNVWVANSQGNSLTEFSNSGSVMSPIGFTGAGVNEPNGIAIDSSGNIWVTNAGNSVLVEFIGAATPVVTPLVVGVKNNTLGARP